MQNITQNNKFYLPAFWFFIQNQLVIFILRRSPFLSSKLSIKLQKKERVPVMNSRRNIVNYQSSILHKLRLLQIG
jgi:hypothetical protein